MGLTVQIQGSAQLRRLAAQMKAGGDKGLGREMSAALRQTSKPVEAAIEREAAAAMPSRGGYRGVFAKSVKFRASLRSGSRRASLTLTTYAAGTSQRRDIVALNRGVLRHPVYGRSRTVPGVGRVPNPWSVTKIRAGFFERGTDDAADEAATQLGRVLDDYARRLAKG